MALALPAALLMGCSSPSGIAVNKRQTVVMDPSVLTAGILADTPSISNASGRVMATSVLNNSQSTPVTVHYRFYWYDAQGWIFALRETARIVVAPDSDTKIYSINGNLDAKSARLYLYL